MADGYLNFDAKVNTKGFNRGVKNINRQTEGLSKSFKSLGKVISGVFVVKKMFDLGKQAVDLASDLQEVQNVVDTAFGSMAYKAEEFAKTAIEQFGLSTLAAKQFASTYMAMGKGSGLNGDLAADMAVDIAGRVGDVASFYNKSHQEVDTMLKSIYTGETESLKRIGVVMTEVNLQQFAYQQGINKSIKAMTQAEKIQLRYAFVMDKTNLAAGDFAKTSDSWANQTRILSERWKEFLSIMGNGLIQALAPTVKFLNSVISKLIEFASVFSTVTTQLLGKQTNISIDSKNVEEAAKAQGDFADETERAGKAAKGTVAGFDEINNLAKKDDNSINNNSTSLGGGTTTISPTLETKQVKKEISSFVTKIQKLLKPLQDINFNNLKQSLENLKEAINPFTETLFEGLSWAYNNLLVPLASWTVQDALPVFLDLLANTLQFLNEVLEPLRPLGEWLWNNFLKPIGEWTGGVIIEVIIGFKDAIKDLIKVLTGETTVNKWVNNMDGKDIFFTALALAIGAVTAAIAIWNIVGAIATGVTTLFGIAVNVLTSPITLVILAITALIAIIILLIKNWDKVKEAATAVWEKIKEIWGIVATWFDENVIKPVCDFFTGLWDGIKNGAINAWNGIKKVFKTISDWVDKWIIQPIEKAFYGFVNGIISMAETIANAFISAVNWIINALNKISIDIPDWAPFGLGGKKFGFNLSEVKKVSIPRLARGGVIDSPTIVQTGEYANAKSNPEIVTPENLMRKIFREESCNNEIISLLDKILVAIKQGKIIAIDGEEFANVVNSVQGDSFRSSGYTTIPI